LPVRANRGTGTFLQAVAKRIGFTLLQLLVTAAGIYYVFHGPQKRAEIGHALRAADWRWLALSWLVYGTVEMLATVRWQMLLRVQGIIVSWLRAGMIVTVGLFCNMLLPGLVGGDAMRLYLLFQNAPRQKLRGTLSVAMDRLLGLTSLVVLAALVVLLRFRWLNRVPQTAQITYLALGLLGGATLGALMVFGLMGTRSLPRRLPFRYGIVQVGKALQLYRKDPTMILGAFLLTILSHLAYYISYYCALRSLPTPAGGEPRTIDFVSIMPLVNTITGVPISFGGVGIRETLFQTLLGQLAHIPLALAAISATLGYAIQVSWGIVGGVAYLLMRPAKASRRG
jgi:uncharacterized protein (TIRG00374 family)